MVSTFLLGETRNLEGARVGGIFFFYLKEGSSKVFSSESRSLLWRRLMEKVLEIFYNDYSSLLARAMTEFFSNLYYENLDGFLEVKPTKV